MDTQELPCDRYDRHPEEKWRELPQDLLLADEYEEVHEPGDQCCNDQTCNDQLRLSAIEICVKEIFQIYGRINLECSVSGFQHLYRAAVAR